MKNTQEVREFAAKQNAGAETFRRGRGKYRELGSELYLGAGGGEHD